MDRSTWTAVWIGGSFISLILIGFLVSLVPPAVRRKPWTAVRDELASWPEQWRELRTDIGSWRFHAGRHEAAAVRFRLSEAHRRANALAVGQASLLRAWAPIVPAYVDVDSSLGRAMLALQVAEDDSACDSCGRANPPDGCAVNCGARMDDFMGEAAVLDVEVTDVFEVAAFTGATDDWSPLADVAGVAQAETLATGVSVAHTAPDLEELTLLADFDAIVSDLRAVPKDLLDFGVRVDESMAAAGMDPELHRRWRAAAFDGPSGEYRLALMGASSS